MNDIASQNLSHSVHQRLLNLSKDRGVDFNLLLIWYGLERLLYRMTRLERGRKFVLKGAMLFPVWLERSFRPTKDLDLLGSGDVSSEGLIVFFREVCGAKVEPDGLDFDGESVRVTEIREGQEYQGQRIRLMAYLGNAKIGLQVDIGVGDVITPESTEITYPTLLDFPPPHIKAYTPETVVAEKFQAMVALDMLNSRMKDFYDLFMMARLFEFQGAVLLKAINETFLRRNTKIPESIPIGLSDEFALNREKANQWKAFLKRTDLETSTPDLEQVVQGLRTFLMPIINATAKDELFDLQWKKGGPWS
jgi:predicted nucleotidyltransferase component of viral defense system